MKVFHMVVCYIVFTALQDGITGRVDAETYIHRRMEGENITVECKFVIPGTKSLFCKEKCEEGNILIETTEDTAESGRYSVKFVKTYFWERDLLYVSITQLQMSDSGLYRCSLDTSLSPHDFIIIVTGATTRTDHPNINSGSSTPSSTSSESIKQPQPLAGPGFSLHLIIRVTVVVLVVMVSVVLLLIFKKKAKDSDGLTARRTSDHNQTEMNLYESCSPVSTCEDLTNQSLDPTIKDQDHIYSSIIQTQ